MGWRDQPALFRHSVVAIYNKSFAGQGADGVIRAMRVARDTLAKSGHLYHAGKQQVLEGIRLTGKGFKQNQHHIREGFAGDRKDHQYARLFKMIEPKLYELDGPGGRKPPKPPVKAQQKNDDEKSGISLDRAEPLFGSPRK